MIIAESPFAPPHTNIERETCEVAESMRVLGRPRKQGHIVGTLKRPEMSLLEDVFKLVDASTALHSLGCANAKPFLAPSRQSIHGSNDNFLKHESIAAKA